MSLLAKGAVGEIQLKKIADTVVDSFVVMGLTILNRFFPSALLASPAWLFIDLIESFRGCHAIQKALR